MESQKTNSSLRFHYLDSIRGMFIGLTTIDFIYVVENPPKTNEKIVASNQMILSGGPATNASITFSKLGGNATLVSGIGTHHLNKIALSEFENYNIKHFDLLPEFKDILPLSSIMIKEKTGERSVVSINAKNNQVKDIPSSIDLKDFDIVLFDGHQMELSIKISAELKNNGTITVFDGGSWKKGTENLLSNIDYVICSENFLPPNCNSSKDVINYLIDHQVNNFAISRGNKPIIIFSNGEESLIHVDSENVVDTLGAGDILHGTFCYYVLKNNTTFKEALIKASKIASLSCKHYGSRKW